MGLKSNRKKLNKDEIKKKIKIIPKHLTKWLGLNLTSNDEIEKKNQ